MPRLEVNPHVTLACVLTLVLTLVRVTDAGAQETAPSSAEGPSSSWPAPKAVVAHEARVQEFRAHRKTTLRGPESWLTLVGLHWLREGSNTLGSGDGMDLTLPETAPDFVGELTHTTSAGVRTIVLVPADGVEIRVDGEPATGPTELRSDAAGEPTQVTVGSVVFYAIDRRGKTAIRVKDSQAKTLREFEGLSSYPVDWRWRVEARYVPYQEGKEIQIPSVLGGSDAAEIPGAVEFDLDGKTHRLDVLPGGEGSLFIIFGDTTNGDTTYGGGRFLYAAAPPAANRPGPVVLDFNMAYSPPCVFSPWATCPLPPWQNRLDVAIEAGEKMYEGYTEGGH